MSAAILRCLRLLVVAARDDEEQKRIMKKEETVMKEENKVDGKLPAAVVDYISI